MSSNSVDREDLIHRVIQNDLLVKTILDNLSAKQLLLTKSVCRRWFGIVKNIVKNRAFFDTFLLVFYPKGFKTNGAQGYENEKKDKKNLLNLVSKSTGVLESENEHSVFQLLNQYFTEQMSDYPDLGIMFTTSSSLTKKLSLQNYLPPSCNKIDICSKAGIIGKSSLAAKPLELEKYQFKVNAITGCFIKKQWGDFKITLTDWNVDESPEPDINDPDYPVRCSLIFSLDFEEGKRFNAWLDRNKNPIALGGALVDKILFQGREVNMLTITFSGKNVKAASLVLDTRTAQEAYCKLTHFKNSLGFDADSKSSDIHTIGFIFICAGRGAAFYQNSINVESDLLYEMFPHVLFTGVFGNGEYGWDCFDRPNCEPDFRSLSQANSALSFTSVVVLVQFTK